MKNLLVLLILVASIACAPEPKEKIVSKSFYEPWKELGVLFHDVQMSGIFPDSKTFVDYTAKGNPEEILRKYKKNSGDDSFDLLTFVNENFDAPQVPTKGDVEIEKPLQEHLVNHWDYLTRFSDAEVENSTLIPMPYKYVVPGGRFREVYYWDSYFTMIGLGASGRLDLVQSMLDNFAYLIDTIGFIPNGNRTYYLGRSQPPYFSSMVSMYAQYQGVKGSLKYLAAVQGEYNFWMEGAESLTPTNPEGKRVVLYKGFILNRYWDSYDSPRPESHREDIELAHGLSDEKAKKLYRDIRAAAESGWDFSTRWFETEDFSSIRTTDLLPVDLNCLLYQSEVVLSALYEANGDIELSQQYQKRSEVRKKTINQFFWNSEHQSYEDVVWSSGEFTGRITAAAASPLYYRIATKDFANQQAETLKSNLLSDGGLLTTKELSGQQWDAPNGWAPLQWLAIKGLEHYGENDLANDIKERWLAVNRKVFVNTSKMMEKYNVSDTTLLAGGGEYPTQDGFGWTNGVVIGLLSEDAKY